MQEFYNVRINAPKGEEHYGKKGWIVEDRKEAYTPYYNSVCIVTYRKEWTQVVHHIFSPDVYIPHKEIKTKKVPIFCEKINPNTFVDVITGEIYDMPVTYRSKDLGRTLIKAEEVSKAANDDVIAILKSLTLEDIAAYKSIIGQAAALVQSNNKANAARQALERQKADFISNFRNNNNNNRR